MNPHATTRRWTRTLAMLLAFAATGVVLTAGCDEATSDGVRQISAPDKPPVLEPVIDGSYDVHRREVVYTAAYSDLYIADGDFNRLFAVTLTVHNTDAERRLIIESIRYFDTHGDLLDDVLSEPHELGPMASANFFVPESDDRGGHGANFVVTWVSEAPVHDPIIESVMASVSSGYAFAFTSRGVPLGERR